MSECKCRQQSDGTRVGIKKSRTAARLCFLLRRITRAESPRALTLSRKRNSRAANVNNRSRRIPFGLEHANPYETCAKRSNCVC